MELWLIKQQTSSTMTIDVLLNNLATIQGTAVERLLYMTAADFDAFNAAGHGLLAAWDAEPGHRVVLVDIRTGHLAAARTRDGGIRNATSIPVEIEHCSPVRDSYLG